VLGWPALLGIVVMASTIPISIYLGKWTASVQEDLMKSTDKRINIMSEVLLVFNIYTKILNGIRIIKYFAFERQFIEKVAAARDEELRNSVKYYITEAVSSVLWHTSPLMVAFATFYAYTKLAGHVLDATTAFTGLALLNSLREPLMSFPHELIQLFQAFVSLNRIEKFLGEQEIAKYSLDSTDISAIDKTIRFGFSDASFTYQSKTTEPKREDTEESDETSKLLPTYNDGPSFTLKNLNFDLPIGGLTVVVGATGCGKSTLIYSLLGGWYT